MAPITALILAGDIGGTNARFAIHKPGSEAVQFVKTYRLSDHASKDKIAGGFVSMLNQFLCDMLAALGYSTSSVGIVACFASAGLVSKNRCVFSNAGLVIDGEELMHPPTEAHSLRVPMLACAVVNDFVGQGYGALTLDMEKEVIALNPKADAIDPIGPICCVGAGTGLGECYLATTNGSRDGYMCFPSEGGHSDFCPRDELQVELLAFLKNKFTEDNRVSVERVASGTGLSNVYEFLAKKYPERIDDKVDAEFNNARDMKGKVVAVNATSGSLCLMAMEIFASVYGAEVSSAAAKFIPTGGLFVTGGLTPKNLKFIDGLDTPFMKAFYDRGRISKMVSSIPVYAVLTEELGLRGARVCAERELRMMVEEEPKKSIDTMKKAMIAGCMCMAAVAVTRASKK